MQPLARQALHVTDAFKLLGNEIRLAILLALWGSLIHSPIVNDSRYRHRPTYLRIWSNMLARLNEQVMHGDQRVALAIPSIACRST